MGSTSGVLLASLVDSAVKTPSNPPSAQLRRIASRPVIVSPRERVSVSSTGTTLPHSLLPPETVTRALHDAYFDHDRLSYPFLNPAAALATLTHAYNDPESLSQDAFFYYSFYMILAIATASVYKFVRESLPDAEIYHVRATAQLHNILQHGDIQALQTILLLCQYRLVSSVQDTYTSMWHLVGIAARMCLELGLHREQVYRRCDGINGQSSKAVVASEIQRRCFWSVIAMDRIVSITLGRPSAIRLQDTDVFLLDRHLDRLLARHDAANNGTRLAGMCLTAIFVHIVRYRVICGDITSTLHTGPTRVQTDAEATLQIRDNLERTLAKRHQYTTDLSLVDEDGPSTPRHQSSFRTRAWYEMLYYEALLML
ncbi:fungal-specific transcription factor domain-containing protein [Aspergillus crustosus]